MPHGYPSSYHKPCWQGRSMFQAPPHHLQVWPASYPANSFRSSTQPHHDVAPPPQPPLQHPLAMPTSYHYPQAPPQHPPAWLLPPNPHQQMASDPMLQHGLPPSASHHPPQIPANNLSRHSTAPRKALLDVSNNVRPCDESTAKKTPQPNSSNPKLIESSLFSFFAMGQRKSLVPFCKDEGLESNRMTILRRIQGSKVLSSIRDGQCKENGFSSGQSRAALNEVAKIRKADILPGERIIEQEHCIGMVSQKAKKLFHLDRETFDK